MAHRPSQEPLVSINTEVERAGGTAFLLELQKQSFFKRKPSHQSESCSGEHQHGWDQLDYAVRRRRQRPSC